MKGHNEMLICSICLFLRKRAKHAVTIINGQAVCLDHTGHVQATSGNHSAALHTAREEEVEREKTVEELRAAMSPPTDEVPPR